VIELYRLVWCGEARAARSMMTLIFTYLLVQQLKVSIYQILIYCFEKASNFVQYLGLLLKKIKISNNCCIQNIKWCMNSLFLVVFKKDYTGKL